MTVGVAGFYIPRRLRKPHFSEFKGSGISVFEFFRGLNFLNVVVLKKFPGLRVRGSNLFCFCCWIWSFDVLSNLETLLVQ